jgi:transposase
MWAYSEDLRVRVVEAVEGGMPRGEVVRVFRVSLPSMKRWLKQWRETGSLAARPVPGAPVRKTVGLRAALAGRLATHADATLDEHCSWWADVSGYSVSTATMSRAITGLGWTRKKSR